VWQFGYYKYMYDFKTNTEWSWSVGDLDHSWAPENIYYLKDKNVVATVDGDTVVRFWKL
jgi:hypothetical protein